MKTIIAFFFTAFVASASLAQDQIQNQLAQAQEPTQGWYQQTSGTVANTTSLFFLNRDTGWAASGTGLLYTTNGGNNWTAITAFAVYNQLFVNSLNGWAEGDTSLLRTSDGGKNWQPIHSPVLGNMQIFGMDTLRIFNGGGPSFAGSDDGGKTWFKDDTSEAMNHAQLGNMFFVNNKSGFLCGYKVGWFLPPPPAKGTVGSGFAFTLDGGKTWKAKFCSLQQELRPMFATDAQHIFVYGENNNGFSYTIDGGNTWKSSINIANSTSQNLFFLNSQIGYSVGYLGSIAYTNDSGKTWTPQNSNANVDLFGLFFIDSLNGWAAGKQGTILHTMNGGKSWVHQYLPFDSIVVQSYPEPAVSSVNIHYTIPSPQHVSLTLYDLTGNVVQIFIQNDFEMQGEHTIPITFSQQLTNGMYYYLFQTEKYQTTGKITILR